MYTPDQYARAKAQVSNAPPERAAQIRARIAAYEESLPTKDRPGKLVGFLDASPEPAAALDPLTVKKQLEGLKPPDTATEAQTASVIANAPPEHADPNIDYTLPNASGRKDLAAPPEYVAKNPLNGIKHVALATLGDPLDGPGAGTYQEPSAEQFMNDQRALLKARGIPEDPNNQQFQDQFAEYKDRKWQQAYEKAAAADQPLTRAEYVDHSRSWDTLKTALEAAPDLASTFAKGFARAATLHATDALAAGSDKLTGRDDVGADRAQTERNPLTEAAGELVGAARPSGPLASLTEGAANAGAKVIPGAAGRIAGSALGGAVAGEADNLGRSVAQGLGDVAHGRSTESAKDNFTSHLLGSGLIGSGFGALGGIATEGAMAGRRALRTSDVGREVNALEQGGGATGLVRGVTPPKAVAENIEAARPPLPGESKLNLEATPTDLAAGKLHEPLTAQNAKDNTEFRARAEKENAQAYAADPNLQQPKPMTKTADAVVDLIKARSLPEAEGKAIPGAEDALPARNNKPFIDLAKKLFKPRLVTSVEAADAARATGGRVISLADAEELGLPVSAMQHEPDLETGVPHDAPPIPDEPGAPAGSTREELFGAADKPTPWDGKDLGPRAGRAKPPPAPEPGSDWDSRGRQEARFEHVRGKQRVPLPGETYLPKPTDDVTRVSNSPPVPMPSPTPSAPTGPPPELMPSSPAAATARAAGLPDDQLRVVLDPRSFDAKKYEEIISALDDAAKAGRAGADVDPAWKDFQRAVRQDREQFSQSWADLKDKHYREQLELEQRAGHANIAKGNKPYSEMDPNAQKAFAGSLPKYGTPAASKDQNDAYRALADAAGPKVRAELETLRAQTAYESLKTKATPNLRESAGAGGATTRIGGLGTATKLRADAAARGISRGPKGLPPIDPKTLSPELLALIRQGNPIAREYRPSGTMANMFSMGKGSLGLKAGSVYNSLTADEQKRLQGLLDATAKEAK